MSSAKEEKSKLFEGGEAATETVMALRDVVREKLYEITALSELEETHHGWLISQEKPWKFRLIEYTDREEELAEIIKVKYPRPENPYFEHQYKIISGGEAMWATHTVIERVPDKTPSRAVETIANEAVKGELLHRVVLGQPSSGMLTETEVRTLIDQLRGAKPERTAYQSTLYELLHGIDAILADQRPQFNEDYMQTVRARNEALDVEIRVVRYGEAYPEPKEATVRLSYSDYEDNSNEVLLVANYYIGRSEVGGSLFVEKMLTLQGTETDAAINRYQDKFERGEAEFPLLRRLKVTVEEAERLRQIVENCKVSSVQ